ncbi:MAG: plasmid SOS inhibition protein A [Enterobacterales bacterium endosymbiont of Blomia tropicalis]|uniref:plasmid SOS inhibition protein A n=1 Tax=Mixta mediterraneensis TaxID=2758443 RepID=UPI0025A7B678|nr:plasmid SOS inhibition protein A [Mixta mediterraneensis]MDL4916197.1 plasmid SOS inhibition protein A [Mixta mediterraneensis]
MIPKSHALVTLLPERQAALQAIAAVEHAQQRGTRLARHPYAAAFMKQLSGRSRVSVRAMNRIRGIYLRPREKRAPLPEWESALDAFLSTAGEVCPLPLPGELASTLFPEAVFRRAERAKHTAEKSVNHVTRRERQAAEYQERQLENRIRQAETELAFRTPETLRGWFAAWRDSVPGNDLKNMIAAWARRFPSLNDLETLQPYAGDVACEVAGKIHLRSLHMDSTQKNMNHWLVPNKLTARNILSRDGKK